MQNTVRRVRTYSRRIFNSARGDLKHPCFFMHVPKSGGTSLSEALYATIPLYRRLGVVDANSTRRATAMLHADKDEILLYHDDLPNGDKVYEVREASLLTHMAWKSPIIHGHILFSHKADTHFGDQYKYVSMLREPVARTVSNFNGSVRHGLIVDDFDAYLESGVFRTHALTTLRYFSGRHEIPVGTEDDALAEAKRVAEKFSVIGFLDDIPAFCDQFRDVFGRKPVVHRYNEAGSKSYRPNDAQMERVREVLAPEFAFWEFAQQRFRR